MQENTISPLKLYFDMYTNLHRIKTSLLNFTSVTEYWRVFVLVSFLHAAIKTGVFASTLHHSYGKKKRMIKIQEVSDKT